MQIKGTCSIITGGASGLGREVAKIMVNKGGKVIIGDIDIKGGNSFVEELNKTGNNAVFVKCDVSKLEELKNLFVVATEKFGGAQIMFNNAGINEPLGTYEKPEVTTHVTDILFTAVVQGCILANAHFQNQRKDHPDREFCIINTSSLSAHIAPAKIAIYAICKRGVMDTTRILSQLGWENVRINAIAPGFTRTKILIDHEGDQTQKLEESLGLMEPDYIGGKMVELVEDSELNGIVRFVTLEDIWDAEALIVPHL